MPANARKRGRGKKIIGRRHKRVKNSVSRPIPPTLSAKDHFQAINSFVTKSLPVKWFVSNDDHTIRIFTVDHIKAMEYEPIKVSISLIIRSDLKWDLFVHGILATKCNNLSIIPDILTQELFHILMNVLSHSSICHGNAIERYTLMCQARKGKFYSLNGDLMAYLEEGYPVSVGSSVLYKTVRHKLCELLVSESKDQCSVCLKYKSNLRAMYSNYQSSQTAETAKNSATNIRFMRTPQRRKRDKLLKCAIINQRRKIQRLRSKLEVATMNNGVNVDEDMEEDIKGIATCFQEQIDKVPNGNFKKVFWNHQVQLMKAKNTKGRRYHPLFIRWCLNIMSVSPLTYNILRESGLFILPSRRTLFDYTHFYSKQSGFQVESFTQLYEDYKVSTLSTAQRHVSLLFDEMKVRQGLVFKQDGRIVGFVDVGDINNNLKALEAGLKGNKMEEDVGDHMLTVMVKGIFLSMSYPLASFPTKDLTGSELHNILWVAVRRLLAIDLHVIAFVSDGSAVNRRFYIDHAVDDNNCSKDGVTYKAINICEPGRYIYFISDACHLIKTTRNCWSHSSFSGTRLLTVNGKLILWKHLLDLQKHCQTNSGLYIGNKLRHEHLHLTSYSRMNVKLAAQVLSKSVADMFSSCRLLKGNTCSNQVDDTTETEKFCRLFNKFFDCMNTRSLEEGKYKRNADLEPYRASDDERLEWLKKDFLGYLQDWQVQVDGNINLNKSARNKMLLSRETLDGLRMTVYSFTEMVPILLQMEGALFLYSERFSQDSLEVFFGKQRMRGKRNTNPTVEQFQENTQAIIISKSLASGGCSNIQKRISSNNIEELCEPLKKKRRTSK